MAPRDRSRVETLDLKTRQRIAGNLRWLMYRNEFVSIAAMAKAIGMSRSALTRYLKGERTTGLDVLLLIHRKLHVSLDWIVDRDPDACWLDPDYWPLNNRRSLHTVPPSR